MLGKYDEEVKQKVMELRSAGTAVNKRIMSAVIRSVLYANDESLLKSNGGAIDPDSRGLIQSCYRRYGLVRRRATSAKAVKKTDREIESIKRQWVQEVNDMIRSHQIRNELIISFDEISAEILPSEDYTMELRGAETVRVIGTLLLFSLTLNLTVFALKNINVACYSVFVIR